MRRFLLVLFSLVLLSQPAFAQLFETEPNNTQTQANTLTSGVALNGSIPVTSDIDWFVFEVATAGTITVKLSTTVFSVPDAELYDSNGQLLAAAPGSRDLTDGNYTVPVTSSTMQAGGSPGTYYVRLSNYRTHGNNSYTITATLPAAKPTVLLAPVFFSTSTDKQSYLRFTNTSDTTPGNVTVVVRDFNGVKLGNAWTKTIQPRTSPQFSMATIEAEASIIATGLRARIEISTTLATGSVQHVVWNPQGGALSNLSMCGSAVGSYVRTLPNVHSSRITAYPSRIVINNNGAAAAALLDVYDSRTGNPVGSWTSPVVPANGSLYVPMADIERAMGFVPAPDQSHLWVVSSATFNGGLYQEIDNLGAGVLVEMTGRCLLTP